MSATKLIWENREAWDIQADTDGQVIVYTGLFIQKNGGFGGKPDPDWDKDPDPDWDKDNE